MILKASESEFGTSRPPVSYQEDVGNWLVLGRDAGLRILRCGHHSVVPDPEMQVSITDKDAVLSVAEFFASWFSRSPLHKEVRKRLSQSFSASHLNPMMPPVERLADLCARRLPPTGDLVRNYLTAYGVSSSAYLLGIPASRFVETSHAVRIETAFLKKRSGFTGGEVAAMEQCISTLDDIYSDVRNNDNDIVRSIRSLESMPGGGRWLAIATFGQLLAAGIEPMTAGLGVVCWRMLGSDERVARGRAALLAYIDEALRLDPPFLFLHRWSMEACNCTGTNIPAGAYVRLDVRAMNTDPTVFNEPTMFDPGRIRRRTLTFGHGAHLCLGKSSARFQIMIGLQALLQSWPQLTVDQNASEIDDSGINIEVKALPYSTEKIR